MTNRRDAETQSKPGAVPNFYRPPWGLPLYWRDEASGRLASCINAYLTHRIGEGPSPTPEQLTIIADYCRHFINAPCWANNNPDDEEMLSELNALRERATTLASAESIARWITECMEVGLDPL